MKNKNNIECEIVINMEYENKVPRVLFINPNPRTMSLIQPVVSLFYGIFRNAGIEMRFWWGNIDF